MLGVEFDYDGGGLGNGGEVRLLVDGSLVASGRIENTVPFLFSMSGETLDVGIDTGSPVGDYDHGFEFSGTVQKVLVEIFPELSESEIGEISDGQPNGAAASQ